MRSVLIGLCLIVILAAASPAAYAQASRSDTACSATDPVRRPIRRSAATESPVDTLAAANRAARQRPSRDGFAQARQVYSYAPGALYEVYTNPSFVSTILLEPGETLNQIAAGDTSRWLVTEANAETEGGGRVIVLVKPQTPGLRTNIVLITDRRTYLVEAISQAGAAYSAQTAWCYPPPVPGAANSSAEYYDHYRIRTVRGREPNWMPTRVFDDGRRTWIEMPPSIASSDMPPLFVITDEGPELVNYRVQGARYVVDRVFERAELRLGTHAPIIVRIDRRERPESARSASSGRQS